MPPTPASERTRSAVTRVRFEPGDPDAYFRALLELLGQQGTRVIGACWHLADPTTGSFTWTGTAGELPGTFVSALENELLADDVGKYDELARRRRTAASIVQETDGDPRRSARFRQTLEPEGFADELRIAFTDPFGRWGSMGLFSDAPFSADETEAATLFAPIVADVLRREVARVAAPTGDGAPGMLVLDALDRVRARDRRAVELLAGLSDEGALPGAIHVLAARARACDGPAAGRMLARHRWIAVDASPLVDEPGAVAVILRPAATSALLEIRLRAAGLTEREREIGFAVLRGDDTAAIAASLYLSPWTVQDHLKVIFDKTGVRSRRAFVARWALEAADAAPVPTAH